MRAVPASVLADRYPGRLAGPIGDAALPSPSSLVIVVGRTPAELAQLPNTVRVTSINDVMPGRFVPQCFGSGCPPPRSLRFCTSVCRHSWWCSSWRRAPVSRR